MPKWNGAVAQGWAGGSHSAQPAAVSPKWFAFTRSQFASDEKSTRRGILVTEDRYNVVSGEVGGGGLRQHIGR